MGSRDVVSGSFSRSVTTVVMVVAVVVSLVAALLSASVSAQADEQVSPQRRQLDFSGEFSDSAPARSRGASALAAALAEARSTGERVAVPEAATETELLWANPDGTVAAEVAQSAVRVREDSGELVDIDLTLREAEGRLAPVAAPVESSLSSTGRGDLGQLELPNGATIGMRFGTAVGSPAVEGNQASYALPAAPRLASEPAGADESDSVASDEAPASDESDGSDVPTESTASTESIGPSGPESAASSASPHDVATDDASRDSLQMLALRYGVAARVVLEQSPQEASVYDFPLRLSGLQATLADGVLSLRDERGRVQAQSAPLVMWDASVDAAGDRARVVPVASELVKPPADSSADVVLRLRPDMRFLADPATQYPVTVDPDISWRNPVTDTYIDRSEPNTAHTNNQALRTGNYGGGTRTRAVIRWHLDRFMGKAVTDATMTLYQFYSATCANRATEVYPMHPPTVSAPGPMTWANQEPTYLIPRFASSKSFNYGGAGGGCGQGGAVDLDVTPQISAYTAHPETIKSERDTSAGQRRNIAMLQLRAGDEDATSFDKRFCSEDYDVYPGHECSSINLVPKLSVTYVPELGDEGWYTMTGEHDLNDRSRLKVNATNGNVFLTNTDIDVASLGMGLKVERFYNSQTEPGQPSTLGQGWSLSLGPDVYLQKRDQYRFYYHKAGGAVYGPFTRRHGETAEPAYRQFHKPIGGVGGRLEDKTNAAENAFVLTMNKTQQQYFFSDIDSSNDNLYLTKITDRSGNEITLSYAAGTHTLETITDTAGRTYEVDYNSAGHIETISEASSGLSAPRTWTYGYNSNGHLDSYTNPAAQRTDYTYTNDKDETGDPSEAQWLLSEITDPLNESGQRPEADLTYAQAQVTGIRYIQGNGEVGYDYEYFVGDEHTRCALPGGSDDPNFEASTDVESTDTSKGHTTYCFRDREHADEAGERTVRVADGNGDKTKQDYSVDNQPTTFTAGANASDESGTGSTVATYGGGGFEDRLASVTMPKDDGANDAAEGTVKYNHTNTVKGGDHLPTSATDMNFACTAYRYDDQGRLTDTYIEQDPGTNLDCSAQTGGKHYRQGYNTDGTIAWRQDPNGGTDDDKRTRYVYWQPADAGYVAGTKGQLKKEIRPGGVAACTADTSTRLCTFYSYDDRARLVAKRDGRGVVTTYAYDALDRTTQVRNDGSTTACTTLDTAAGDCVTYSYDAAGNMMTREDVNEVTTFDYDQLNRQRAVTTNDGLLSATEVAYDYNDDGKLTRLTQSENNSVVNQVGYAYDDANYPDTATVNPDAYPSDQLTVELDQNKNGKHNKTVFTDMSTPIQIDREHSKAGRLSAIDVHEQSTTSAKRARLVLDYDLGALETNMLRSVTVSGTGSAAINGTASYTYGGPYENRKLEAVTDNATGAPNYDYVFDAAGNVREEKKGATSTFYGYDRAGQLCWEDTTDHTGAALVDNCGQATSPGTATDYGHDEAGNSLGTTADPYGYNDFDQVDQIDGVDQKYRDLGNDIRIANGETTMVDSSVGVISRTTGTGAGAETTYYLYDPDGGILASYPSMHDTGYQDDAIYYVTNHQKSVFMLLDANGARAGWYRYSPYGDPTIVDQTAGAAGDNPWRYLSAYYSPDNGGYHHLGARMYDNRSHFTQPDPERGNLENPLRTLSYGYSGGDSINQSDASGRWLDDVLELGGSALLGWDVASIWAGGVTGEELAYLAASEGFGIAAESLCIGVSAAATAGAGLVAASIGCFAAGEALSYGAQQALESA